MDKTNCWEYLNCGKGPDSSSPCNAAKLDIATGYLNGEKGGRACMYVPETDCFTGNPTIPQKLISRCLNCEFFIKLRREEGDLTNLYYYLEHIHNKLLQKEEFERFELINIKLFKEQL